MKRTTIEIDENLLARAKKALGARTTRATVEEALRRAAEQAESAAAERTILQRSYLDEFSTYADSAVLSSDEMWR